MIDTNELRLNNWVNSKEQGFIQVDSIERGAINIIVYMSFGEIDSLSENDIDPIELTPEILLKCGFEKIGGCYQLGQFIVQPDMGVYIEYDSGIGGSHYDHFCHNVESLHMLQNVYYFHQGKELAFSQ